MPLTSMVSLPLPKRQTLRSTRDDLYFRIKDAYIPTRDESELCADMFLPLSTEHGAKVPVLLSMCPYGKDIPALEYGLPQTEIYAQMNSKIKPLGPDAVFEALDPLVWTKEYGYAVIRIDCRGVGGTPGLLDPFGIQRSMELGQDAEGNDLYDAIEWASHQSWCNGKVGMSGISYLGMVCWRAARQNPPSLKAIIPWEAGNDLYGSLFRPGGISNTNFLMHWWRNTVLPYQHGRAEGVSEEVLQDWRVDFPELLKWEFRSEGPFPLLDRIGGLEKVQVPFYSAANWVDTEVHAPGNILGYMWAASKFKYLETHSGDHVNAFYGTDGRANQKKFLDRFLKDDHRTDNQIPRVNLTIRRGSSMYRRMEAEFPPLDTQYRELFLAADGRLQDQSPESGDKEVVTEYHGLKESRIFVSEPIDEDFEVLGFPYLELRVATEARDMDFFLTIMNLDPNGKLVELEGNHGEVTVAVSRGYTRLSHRELDDRRATEHFVVLEHQRPAAVKPHELYKIKMPVHPTSMIFEKGHRIQLELGARDSETLLDVMRHEGLDRTEKRFAGKNILFGGSKIIFPFVERASQ